MDQWTGIVCGNCWSRRGNYPPCQRAWHAKCYKSRQGDKYPIASLDCDDGDDDLKDDVEENKFKFARLGDNFCVPFQCDLCHFRNVYGRNPLHGLIEDNIGLIAIRRAILDSFWGRATATVENNFRELKKYAVISECRFGLMKNYLPDMGPFSLKDEWGMRVAMAILERSLDKGKNNTTIQFATARKIRSAYSSCWNSSAEILNNSVMAKDTAKIYSTNCPTYTLWFERYMKGLHHRMGDNRRPNTAIGSRLMKAIIRRVNLDYLESGESHMRQRFYARSGLYFLSAFFGGLRGEEVPRILRKHFIELNRDAMMCQEGKHVVLPMFGNFKGDSTRRCYLKRVSCISKSGLNMELWVERVMSFESESGTRFLFADSNGNKEKGSTYEGYLFSVLENIQKEEVGLINGGLIVSESYGISRSFRRGATTMATEAPNCECDEDDINRNNRWRREHNAGTKHPDLNMLQLYTDTMQSVQAELKFSKCL